MLKFEGKVSRALKRQRIKLQLPMPALPSEEESQRQNELTNTRTRTSRKTENNSQMEGEKAGVTSRKAPHSQAFLHKIKNQQRKIKAKATAVSNVISQTDITENPKALAKAG